MRPWECVKIGLLLKRQGCLNTLLMHKNNLWDLFATWAIELVFERHTEPLVHREDEIGKSKTQANKNRVTSFTSRQERDRHIQREPQKTNKKPHKSKNGHSSQQAGRTERVHCPAAGTFSYTSFRATAGIARGGEETTTWQARNVSKEGSKTTLKAVRACEQIGTITVVGRGERGVGGAVGPAETDFQGTGPGTALGVTA